MTRQMPLRAVDPKLFQQLQAELEKMHIHPYDVEAVGVKQENGTEVILKFGANFSHHQSRTFSDQEVEKADPAISQFFKEVGEECQKVLVADYFKMMKS